MIQPLLDPASNGPNLHEAFANPSSRVPTTCVFIDMVNSTAMKAAIPESGWLPQVGFLYDAVVAAFGVLDDSAMKFLGDGALVFLEGDDRAHDAISNAIEVQQIVQDAGRPVDGAMGKIGFHVTIGITTGIVHRFSTPDGRTDWVGLTVDRAARLCSAASAQAIFIDRSTVTATNFNRVTSSLGRALHRSPDDYQGERQSVTLKGIAAPVDYHEILWSAQLYGVKSEFLTRSTQEGEKAAAPKAALPDRPLRVQTEKLVGRVKCWFSDKGFGFVTSDDGEDFFIARNLMVYPEDADELRPGVRVAFVAVDPSAVGRQRRAGALLVAGDYADGRLVSPAVNRPYGWIEVRDESGTVQLVFASVTDLGASYGKGDELNFKLDVGPRGARAVDIGPVSEKDVA